MKVTERWAMICVLAVATSGLSCCSTSGALADTLQESCLAFKTIRPSADLDGVTSELWLEDSDYLKRIELTSGGQVHFPFAKAAIQEWGDEFDRLGIIALDVTRHLFSSKDTVSPHFLGTALPTVGVILVKPGHADSKKLLLHELSHITAHRKRYLDNARLRMLGKVGDVAFVDLDAVIASWALEEGIAETTARCGMFANDEESAAFWRVREPLAFRLCDFAVTGPATLTRSDGTKVVLKKGEIYAEDHRDFVRRLMAFAYSASIRIVRQRRVDQPDLDATFEPLWRQFSYTTREILYPESVNEPSGLKERCAKLKGSVAASLRGATRVGAFLTREMLLTTCRLSSLESLALVEAFRDDVFCVMSNGEKLWVSEWKDVEARQTFADKVRKAGSRVDVSVRGSFAMLRSGNSGEGDHLIDELLKGR